MMISRDKAAASSRPPPHRAMRQGRLIAPALGLEFCGRTGSLRDGLEGIEIQWKHAGIAESMFLQLLR